MFLYFRRSEAQSAAAEALQTRTIPDVGYVAMPDAVHPFRPYNASMSCGRGNRLAAGTPHVDAGEQEQPHDVDEVPVPGGKFESEVLLGCEMTEKGADQADGEE